MMAARRFVLSTCMFALASCAQERDMSPLARGAVDEFHARLKNRQYEAIFAAATEDFRRSMGTTTSALFARISTTLGVPVSSQLTRLQVNHMTRGPSLQVQCQTQYTRGVLYEQFTWRVERDRVRLVAYGAGIPAPDR